ncbi:MULTISPECIES: hypothetical protein [Weeksellaceae]|uniref:hypothetical protein n=1 Tax=Weeksellaceae TaxID=2762318 RepID=UPI0012ADFB8B|nr:MULTISPECIES: hypothetical protein [Weeksellaceae]MDY3338258.1 hypothetical protein [Riemerella anatipestifer]MEC5395702.1 hypothetical protein [Bergeyella sp. RCAD1439]USL94705.1 hypothetical protein D1J36_005190 [Riemerella anatipestifer]
MVRIINYKQRVAEDGREFFALEISGGIEMVQSQTTGQYYATAKKAYITSTFDEETCKALIGTEMAGSVERQSCEPYEYTNRETGEVTILEHRYVYVPEKSPNPAIEKNFETNSNSFSRNGKYELEQAF